LRFWSTRTRTGSSPPATMSTPPAPPATSSMPRPPTTWRSTVTREPTTRRCLSSPSC